MNRPTTVEEDKTVRARSLCERGAWREVLTFAQRWHEEDPADFRALYYLGLGFSGLGQFAQAETAYRRALALNASDFKVWNNLAGILFEAMGRPTEAIAALEQALKMDPRNKLGWANLASMVGWLGRHEQSLQCAERALALDPQMVEAHLRKARAAQALGKRDLVRESCLNLATISPEQFRRVH